MLSYITGFNRKAQAHINYLMLTYAHIKYASDMLKHQQKAKKRNVIGVKAFRKQNKEWEINSYEFISVDFAFDFFFRRFPSICFIISSLSFFFFFEWCGRASASYHHARQHAFPFIICTDIACLFNSCVSKLNPCMTVLYWRWIYIAGIAKRS